VRLRLVVVALVLVCVSLAAQTKNDPFVGTWKLDVARSTYSPGPASRGEILTSEPYGDNGINTTAKITDAQGKQTVTAYHGNFDEKDSPITGDANADTTSLKRIDAYTMVRTNKKAGKVTTTVRREVSKDGKTLTVTQTGTDINGRTIHNVTVFDKQ
jgi:hypothetical protein